MIAAVRAVVVSSRSLLQWIAYCVLLIVSGIIGIFEPAVVAQSGSTETTGRPQGIETPEPASALTALAGKNNKQVDHVVWKDRLDQLSRPLTEAKDGVAGLVVGILDIQKSGARCRLRIRCSKSDRSQRYLRD